jgi:hypothetical protein
MSSRPLHHSFVPSYVVHVATHHFWESKHVKLRHQLAAAEPSAQFTILSVKKSKSEKSKTVVCYPYVGAPVRWSAPLSTPSTPAGTEWHGSKPHYHQHNHGHFRNISFSFDHLTNLHHLPVGALYPMQIYWHGICGVWNPPPPSCLSLPMRSSSLRFLQRGRGSI